jgi:hypothetical protein
MSARVASILPFLAAGKQKMMKKRKPPGSVMSGRKQSRKGATADDGGMWVGRKPLRSSATGPPPAGSGTRGRLNRAVLAMLGKGLEDCFDEVRKQEVPERFKLLLQRF